MKITSQTSDTLVIEDSGAAYRVSGLVLVLAFLSFALFMGYICYLTNSYDVGDFIFIVLPGLLAFMGLYAFLYATDISVSINKSNNRIDYLQKRTINSKSSSYHLDDVSRVETRWINQYLGFIAYTPAAEVSMQSLLILKSGEEIPLNNFNSRYYWRLIGDLVYWAMSIIISNQEKIGVAPLVASFIGVPFKEIEPPQG